jgi:hypothetical protein
VGLNEAEDLETVNRFRLHRSSGFVMGKWFATTFDDAVGWGRQMQRFSFPRPFRIAMVRLPANILAEFAFYERYDTIGPAYLVPLDRLTMLNRSGTITVLPGVYDVEEPT